MLVPVLATGEVEEMDDEVDDETGETEEGWYASCAMWLIIDSTTTWRGGLIDGSSPVASAEWTRRPPLAEAGGPAGTLPDGSADRSRS